MPSLRVVALGGGNRSFTDVVVGDWYVWKGRGVEPWDLWSLDLGWDGQ